MDKQRGQSPAERIFGHFTDPKRCTRCGEMKPLTEFGTFRRDGKLYYRPGCRRCAVKSVTAYKTTNRERINRRGRERRLSAREERLAAERAWRLANPETTRRCNACGETKPLTEFAKLANDKHRRRCKACVAAAQRAWRDKNPEHVKEWHRAYAQKPERKAAHRERERRYYRDKNLSERRYERRLRENYGGTLEQYYELLDEQGGVCAIHGGKCKSGRRLGVDHNHETGEIRGALCGTCNRGIGYLDDDPELVANALVYLLKYSGDDIATRVWQYLDESRSASG